MSVASRLAVIALCTLAGCAQQLVKVEPGLVTVRDAITISAEAMAMIEKT